MKRQIRKWIKKILLAISPVYRKINNTQTQLENIYIIINEQKENLNIINNNIDKILKNNIYEATGSNNPPGVVKKNFRDKLYTPTFIQKIDNLYYIVDCWHHRIIYSDTIERPIYSWNILDENIGGPHSISGDNNYLFAENTGYNSIKVFKRNAGDGYNFHKELSGVGIRPHKIEYCAETKLFYVIGSQSSEVYCFKTCNDSDNIILHFVKELGFLSNSYTRSIRIIDDKMYFVSGNNKIVITSYKDEKFSILSEYSVPNELSSMNDIYKKDNWFFITATPKKFVCTQNLNGLVEGCYIDLYKKYNFMGTPYYFSDFDGFTYLPEITEYSSITRFKIRGCELYDFERVHDIGKESKESIERKMMYKV